MKLLGIILLPLLGVDLFYVIYVFFCKILLKRYKITEKKFINDENYKEITLEDVKDKKILIMYIVSTFIGIGSYFFSKEMYMNLSILNCFITEFKFIIVSFLLILSFYTIVKKIIYTINYSKGFIDEFKKNKRG